MKNSYLKSANTRSKIAQDATPSAAMILAKGRSMAKSLQVKRADRIQSSYGSIQGGSKDSIHTANHDDDEDELSAYLASLAAKTKKPSASRASGDATHSSTPRASHLALRSKSNYLKTASSSDLSKKGSPALTRVKLKSGSGSSLVNKINLMTRKRRQIEDIGKDSESSSDFGSDFDEYLRGKTTAGQSSTMSKSSMSRPESKNETSPRNKYLKAIPIIKEPPKDSFKSGLGNIKTIDDLESVSDVSKEDVDDMEVAEHGHRVTLVDSGSQGSNIAEDILKDDTSTDQSVSEAIDQSSRMSISPVLPNKTDKSPNSDLCQSNHEKSVSDSSVQASPSETESPKRNALSSLLHLEVVDENITAKAASVDLSRPDDAERIQAAVAPIQSDELPKEIITGNVGNRKASMDKFSPCKTMSLGSKSKQESSRKCIDSSSPSASSSSPSTVVASKRVLRMKRSGAKHLHAVEMKDEAIQTIASTASQTENVVPTGFFDFNAAVRTNNDSVAEPSARQYMETPAILENRKFSSRLKLWTGSLGRRKRSNFAKHQFDKLIPVPTLQDLPPAHLFTQPEAVGAVQDLDLLMDDEMKENMKVISKLHGMDFDNYKDLLASHVTVVQEFLAAQKRLRELESQSLKTIQNLLIELEQSNE